MWPNSRSYSHVTSAAASLMGSQQRPAMSSATNADIMTTANSLRNLFGDSSQSLFQTMGTLPTASRPESSLSQLASRRPLVDRHVIDYENPNYSRLDRSLMSQMSSGSAQPYSHSPPARTETTIYDPMKMPQKSILKKSKEQSYDAPVHTIDDEDSYLYGEPQRSSGRSDLPPGIVPIELSRDGAATRSPGNGRALSPISLRLKREMESMQNKSRREPEPQGTSGSWTPRMGLSAQRNEEPFARNEWERMDAEEEAMYRRRFAMNASPEPVPSLELERVRIQQMAAIQAGILQQADKAQKRLDSPPSPQTKHRRMSPEMSPKRVRRRTRTPSPRRRRSISPHHRSRSPRRRTPSPRRRSISPRFRHTHRSRSPDRSRGRSPDRSRDRSPNRGRDRSRDAYRRTRSRSRSPPPKRRRSPEHSTHSTNLVNPMAVPIQMSGQGMPYDPLTYPLVAGPMGPLIMPGTIVPGTYSSTYMVSGLSPTGLPGTIHKRSVQDHDKAFSHSSPRKLVEKKEDKLINPHDLLVAEKTKLRSRLEDLKSQYYRSVEEQKQISVRDGGSKESYAYKNMDRVISDIRHSMEETQKKLLDNVELTRVVQSSKAKAREVMERVKEMGDISKVTWDMLKRKETPKKSVKAVPQRSRTPERRPVKEVAKPDKKEVITVDSEDEEKSSRFHYFDSGPHWCKPCDKFVDNMKNYFIHVHSKEHVTKQKESERTPWITKEYIREAEKHAVKGKDQLMVASKGIQFILPVQGFYCNLCKEFVNDSYQAQKHFKSAKHNRSYTRYTLQNSDYEHKWKVERDRAFTDMKRKEREQERENIRLEAQKKAEDRKRLEEEVKRKDRDLKERIEAMKKSQKSVKELDDSKSETKSEDKREAKTKPSPKSIRLNLSSKSNEKNKSPDKSKDKQKKLKTMGESADTSEDIDDMLVIDEFNCDETTHSESKPSEDNIDENALLYPESDRNVSKSDGNETQNESKTEENVITIMDSAEEVGDKTEEKTKSIEDNAEINDKSCDNEEQTEEVLLSKDENMPKEDIDKNSNNETNSDLNDGKEDQKEETNAKSEEVVEPKSDDKDKTEDKGEDKAEDKSGENGSKSKEESDPKELNQENRVMTYAEIVSKGSEDSSKKQTNEEKVSESDSVLATIDDKPKNGSNETEESKQEDKEEVKIEVKTELKTEEKSEVKLEEKSKEKSNAVESDSKITSDFDDDILRFEQQLKNLESMTNKDSVDPDGEDDDPLDGFDVIDETKELIDLNE